MAGDWIKMRCDLVEDPAVIGMAASLDMDEFQVVGRLQFLWSWANRQSRDGHALGVTQSWIDRKVQCAGFSNAMCEFGWLKVAAEGVCFPNFERHNGENAKTRALAALRQQRHRADNSQETTPSRPQRDQGVTREEEEEEEEERKSQAPKHTQKRDHARVPTVTASVCLAVKAAGVASVNPADPRLQALLERGASVDLFVAAAPAALGKRNPWAYLLGTVEGQITAAAAIAAGPKAPPSRPSVHSRSEQAAQTLADLCGFKQPKKDNEANCERNAIDVESRVVGS